MPQYEGFVASITNNGKAEVIIRPGKQCIPDAPEVSEKVCHCATDGSTVVCQALNRAGASVGDRVRVSRSARVVRKNVVTLLGIPLAGLALGVIAGVILGQASVLYPTGAVIVAGAGLVLGILVAVLRYRQVSDDNLPVITHVIKTRLEMAQLGENY